MSLAFVMPLLIIATIVTDNLFVFPINVLHIVECDTDLYLYTAKKAVSVNQHNDQFNAPAHHPMTSHPQPS